CPANMPLQFRLYFCEHFRHHARALWTRLWEERCNSFAALLMILGIHDLLRGWASLGERKHVRSADGCFCGMKAGSRVRRLPATPEMAFLTEISRAESTAVIRLEARKIKVNFCKAQGI